MYRVSVIKEADKSVWSVYFRHPMLRDRRGYKKQIMASLRTRSEVVAQERAGEIEVILNDPRLRRSDDARLKVFSRVSVYVFFKEVEGLDFSKFVLGG